MLVAFDVDGTLIDYKGNPRQEVIDFLKACQGLKMTVIVWSGGGVQYAKNITLKLGLSDVQIMAK